MSASAAVRDALGDGRSAAVASHLASELYGLPLLRDHIEDRAENVTRFVVVAREDAPPDGRRQDDSGFFAAQCRGAGAPRSVLDVFDRAGINFRASNHAPRDRAWEYVFHADLEGHRTDPAVARALDELRGFCDMVKVLGSYPRYAPPRT